MLIPVDGQDLALPDDVIKLIKKSDLVGLHEVPQESYIVSQSNWRDLIPAFNAEDTQLQAIDPGLLRRRDQSINIPQLENWTVQANAYSTDVAGKIGLLGRLFGGEAQAARAGVVHEAKRFTIHWTEQSRPIQIGVAVRIYAATRNWDANIQLTLPNLAADAQLHARDSRVAIEVVGYLGPLGSRLPSPERLDVESFTKYLKAFRDVQALVFGESGLPFLMPTLLSYEDSP
jgi:hypothetical protein